MLLAIMTAAVALGAGASPKAGLLKADLLVTNQPGTVFLRWQQGKPFELALRSSASATR
jgi:hypothetical protein